MAAAAEEGISAGRTSMMVCEHRKIDGNPADQQMRDLGCKSLVKLIFFLQKIAVKKYRQNGAASSDIDHMMLHVDEKSQTIGMLKKYTL